MNREKHQADGLHVVDDSMSFDEIPKKPVGLSLGMKPLGQSHFLSPPPTSLSFNFIICSELESYKYLHGRF